MMTISIDPDFAVNWVLLALALMFAIAGLFSTEHDRQIVAVWLTMGMLIGIIVNSAVHLIAVIVSG